MSTKLLAVLSLVWLLSGCEGVVVVDRPHHRPRPVVVYQTAPVVVAQPAPVAVQPAPVVVVQPAPTYVEEGAVVGGVVVAEPAAIEGYVLLGGGWYYWHPGLHVWVHSGHPGNWHPEHGRVYRGWAEHPMYHH